MVGIVVTLLWIVAVSFVSVALIGPVPTGLGYVAVAVATYVFVLLRSGDSKFGHSLDWLIAVLWPAVPLLWVWDAGLTWSRGRS